MALRAWNGERWVTVENAEKQKRVMQQQKQVVESEPIRIGSLVASPAIPNAPEPELTSSANGKQDSGHRSSYLESFTSRIAAGEAEFNALGAELQKHEEKEEQAKVRQAIAAAKSWNEKMKAMRQRK